LIFKEAKCGVLPGNVFGMDGKNGEVWFRITLLHDKIEEIIKGLKKIECVLINKI